MGSRQTEKIAPAAPASQPLISWLTAPGPKPPHIITSQDHGLLATLPTTLALAVACSKHHEAVQTAGCADCHLIAAREHPRVTILQSDTATITIKQVRQLLHALARTTSGHRLAIIPAAEKLSPPAANALLKKLEEPSADTRFALITAWPQRLPATVRSRCELYRLTPFSLPGRRDGDEGSKNDQLESESHPSPVPSPLEGRGELSKSLVDRLGEKREELDEATLTAIAEELSRRLHTDGPSSELRRAYLRLRDYHLIKARRGNIKLATDVLLASLPK